MLRNEFIGCFLGYIIKKSPYWLPEEAPEEMFFDVLNKRIDEHSKEIKEVLIRNGKDG